MLNARCGRFGLENFLAEARDPHRRIAPPACFEFDGLRIRESEDEAGGEFDRQAGLFGNRSRGDEGALRIG